MPVDARAGIPARCRLRGIVGAHRQDVAGFGAELQMAGEFVAKADVAVRPLAQVEAVDPHVAVGHDAVEFDEHALVGVGRRQREMLAIPADAAGQERARAAGGILFVERAFDAPVVRHVDGAPGAVVEVGLFRAGGVGFQEAPAGIEGGDIRGLQAENGREDEGDSAYHGSVLIMTRARAGGNGRQRYCRASPAGRTIEKDSGPHATDFDFRDFFDCSRRRANATPIRFRPGEDYARGSLYGGTRLRVRRRFGGQAAAVFFDQGAGRGQLPGDGDFRQRHRRFGHHGESGVAAAHGGKGGDRAGQVRNPHVPGEHPAAANRGRRRSAAEGSREDHRSVGVGRQTHPGVHRRQSRVHAHRGGKGGQRSDPLHCRRFHFHRSAEGAVQQLGPDADALLHAGDRGGQQRRIGRIAARFHRRAPAGRR